MKLREFLDRLQNATAARPHSVSACRWSGMLKFLARRIELDEPWEYPEWWDCT